MEDVIFKTKWKKNRTFSEYIIKFQIPLMHNSFFFYEPLKLRSYLRSTM